MNTVTEHMEKIDDSNFNGQQQLLYEQTQSKYSDILKQFQDLESRIAKEQNQRHKNVALEKEMSMIYRDVTKMNITIEQKDSMMNLLRTVVEDSADRETVLDEIKELNKEIIKQQKQEQKQQEKEE